MQLKERTPETDDAEAIDAPSLKDAVLPLNTCVDAHDGRATTGWCQSCTRQSARYRSGFRPGRTGTRWTTPSADQFMDDVRAGAVRRGDLHGEVFAKGSLIVWVWVYAPVVPICVAVTVPPINTLRNLPIFFDCTSNDTVASAPLIVST